jgi:hypothetical protein
MSAPLIEKVRVVSTNVFKQRTGELPIVHVVKEVTLAHTHAVMSRHCPSGLPGTKRRARVHGVEAF